MSFDKKAYNNAYNKKKYTGVSFRLHSVNDADVLEALKDIPNVKEYLCKLVRQDKRRNERKHGYQYNRGDRKVHLNYKKYPFEVIEFTGLNGRYTVAYAENYDIAQGIAAAYLQNHPEAAPVAIYERIYDDHIHAYAAVQVN